MSQRSSALKRCLLRNNDTTPSIQTFHAFPNRSSSQPSPFPETCPRMIVSHAHHIVVERGAWTQGELASSLKASYALGLFRRKCGGSAGGRQADSPTHWRR
ncbi:hypothetical protein I7I53_02839 [Histoplasma capsulatum var. duboisii H88]|uniref:Uncharacterized protein n=1 Tax=Ajellomyces capsulatus (strain H88) TaxID=544711 RepID=A0A8A1LM74_AJEC8|nr:hypothetical protein I7I53_02839 [Histoplasma capsulatum var. duboisii H88]